MIPTFHINFTRKLIPPHTIKVEIPLQGHFDKRKNFKGREISG